jgi:hypothetical protein
MVRGVWESGACEFARKSAPDNAKPASENPLADLLIAPNQQVRRSSRTTSPFYSVRPDGA